MKKKHLIQKTVMLSALLTPSVITLSSVSANDFYQNQSSAQAADITNWIANTPEQISNNLAVQNINPENLEGEQYIIQWGDTLWGISQATGISIEKLAYDNNILNVDLIFAGDVLILKRDGVVPAGYRVEGHGHNCAMTKVVINNYYGDQNNVIINNSTFVSDDHSQHTTVYAPDNSDNSLSFSNTTTNNVTVNGSSSASETSSTGSSSTEANKDNTKTSSSSDANVLKEDEFKDSIQSEVETLYQEDKNSPRTASISFLPYDHEQEATTKRLKADLEETSLYTEAGKAKEKVLSEFKLDLPKTEDTAKQLAKAIYNQLKRDNKLNDIIEAEKAQIIISSKDDKYSFNVSLYNGKVEESSTDSSPSSQEVERSETETRMSSRSSSSASSSYSSSSRFGSSSSDDSSTEMSDSVTESVDNE